MQLNQHHTRLPYGKEMGNFITEEIGNFIRDCSKAASTYVWRLLTSHLILNLLTVLYMFVLLQ